MKKLEIESLELINASSAGSWLDGFCAGASVGGAIVAFSATGPGLLIAAGAVAGVCAGYAMKKYL